VLEQNIVRYYHAVMEDADKQTDVTLADTVLEGEEEEEGFDDSDSPNTSDDVSSDVSSSYSVDVFGRRLGGRAHDDRFALHSQDSAGVDFAHSSDDDAAGTAATPTATATAAAAGTAAGTTTAAAAAAAGNAASSNSDSLSDSSSAHKKQSAKLKPAAATGAAAGATAAAAATSAVKKQQAHRAKKVQVGAVGELKFGGSLWGHASSSSDSSSDSGSNNDSSSSSSSSSITAAATTTAAGRRTDSAKDDDLSWGDDAGSDNGKGESLEYHSNSNGRKLLLDEEFTNVCGPLKVSLLQHTTLYYYCSTLYYKYHTMLMFLLVSHG
jgi:hypothetical protein